MSVNFDSTMRLGKAMAIIIHFVEAEWTIQQCLVCMQLLAKRLTGEEIARELLFALQAQYGVATDSTVATM